MSAQGRYKNQLLPKSGVGVVPPWLVIAPLNHAVIRLDLRLVDRVEVQYESSPAVVLECGELQVALGIADGPEAAERLVAAITPWTRDHADRNADPVRGERPVTHGGLVVVSATADAKPAATDSLAGSSYVLAARQVTIGRADDNDIVIVHRSISREHAKVTRDPETDRFTITELSATNGLRVNGASVRTVELSSGDLVDLGHVRLRFIAPGEEDFLHEPAGPAHPDRFLFVGNEAALRRGERIQIGARAFRIDAVRAGALRGENLSISGSRSVQASLCLLVVDVSGCDAIGGILRA